MKKKLSPLALSVLAAGILSSAGGLEGQTKRAPERTVETVATVPSAGTTESLCETPDGSIYITGMDDKVIWKVRPGGRLERFADFPALGAVIGVAASRDGLVITAVARPLRRAGPRGGSPPAAGGTAAAPPSEPPRDLSDSGPQVMVLDKSGAATAIIPGQKGLLNGIAPAGRGLYVIADSTASTIWQLDPARKRLEPWLKDDALAPAGTFPIGANGIKVHNGWVYVSVSGRDAIYRVQMGTDGRAKGALSQFAHAPGLFPDDFDIAKDGTIYLSTGMTMYKISPSGEVSKFLENVPNGAAALVSRDGKWLYWSTRGGTAPQRLLRVAIR
jgi:sugar lactone lactonase YvrE